jgi:hypothetical protein
LQAGTRYKLDYTLAGLHIRMLITSGETGTACKAFQDSALKQYFYRKDINRAIGRIDYICYGLYQYDL